MKFNYKSFLGIDHSSVSHEDFILDSLIEKIFTGIDKFYNIRIIDYSNFESFKHDFSSKSENGKYFIEWFSDEGTILFSKFFEKSSGTFDFINYVEYLDFLLDDDIECNRKEDFLLNVNSIIKDLKSYVDENYSQEYITDSKPSQFIRVSIPEYFGNFRSNWIIQEMSSATNQQSFSILF